MTLPSPVCDRIENSDRTGPDWDHFDRNRTRADFDIFSQGGWRVSQGGWKFFAADATHWAIN